MNDPAIQNSRNKLLASFKDSPDLVFIRAWGNVGDELIYAGTRQLLSGLDYREISTRDLQNASGHTALLAGSGGWCKPFHVLPSFLPAVEQRFQSVIVLPSSFDTSEEIVRKTLEKTSAMVFARELVSYRAIHSLCRADVAHDCAFFFDYGKYRRDGRGVLNAFRSDAESNGKPLPEGNIDISMACSSLDEWLWTISKYAIVRTDRAHVMIAAALLGKRVEYDASIYHKVPAIAEYAFRQYPVARLSDRTSRRRATLPADDLSPVSRFASFLAEDSACSNVVIIDDLESHDFEETFSKGDIVVIPNAIASLVRLPHRIAPLKKMLQEVGKALLVDDIHSFPDTRTIDAFLERHGFPVEHLGFVNVLNRKAGTLALIAANKPPRPLRAPDDFRIVAVMSSYNEGDIIVPVIEQLRRDGVDVYLIDNWSTDDTYHKAQSLLGQGLIGLERFPAEGPSPTYDWREVLKRKEELCMELEADWFIHHDADEYRQAPWQGVRLRDAIYWVDQQGYNAIDFTVLNFVPVDNHYQAGASFIDHFRYCEFGKNAACFAQTKAWKATKGGVTLTESGGHSADFVGRNTYPYKFLLRHYPIRSQSHGERKIFEDRKQRFNPKEKKDGWHSQYDTYAPGTSFLKNPTALIEFNSNFYPDFLIERLSGIGVIPPETILCETLSHRVEESERAVRTLAQQAAERTRSIQTLTAQLAEITGSKAWKIALLIRKVRGLGEKLVKAILRH